jgi:hypothetical protein
MVGNQKLSTYPHPLLLLSNIFFRNKINILVVSVVENVDNFELLKKHKKEMWIFLSPGRVRNRL